MNAVVMQMFKPDASAMAAHVEHLFGGFLDGYHEGRIELAWTDTRPDEGGRFRLKNAAWFGTDQLDELVAEACRLNVNPNCNVYIGAALRRPDVPPFGRSKDDDAWALTALYADLDDEGTASRAKEIYGTTKPTMVVVTGREPYTRAQLWWRLEEPLTDADAWPAQLRGLAVALHADTTVTNPGRVMRLAGSIAWPVKEGRTAIEVTHIVPLKVPGPPSYQIEQLTAQFVPIVEGTAGAISATAIVRSTNSLGLPSKVGDGRDIYMRDVVAAVLLEYIGTNGCAPTEQELFDIAWPQYAANADTVRPGHGVKAMELKVRYALRRFEQGAIKGMRNLDEAVATYATKQKMRPVIEQRIEQAKEAEAKAEGPSGNLLLSASEFVAGFTPPEYLIDGMIQRGYLYSLTARTGHGKTAVDMFICQAVARGLKIQTREVEQGSVLFLAGENPDDIRARYLVLAEKFGFDPGAVPFHFVNGVIDIEASLPRIREEAAAIDNLKLIVVDTAAAYFKGDDGNSNVQQGSFARVLRQLTFVNGLPAVIVNCHPVKNASKENLVPLGGGAFLNEVDGNLTLWADAEEQTTLHWSGKFRGPEFEPITFKIEAASCEAVKDSKGRLMPSVVARPIGEVEIEMGQKASETDENILLAIIGNNRPLSVAELAKKASWLLPNGAPYKSKTFRVLGRLADQKMVKMRRGKRYALTPEGRKEIGLDDD